MRSRFDLGFDDDTYVADPKAFAELMPPPASVSAWYSRFWELEAEGVVIDLTDRIQVMPDEACWRRAGDDVWLELRAGDRVKPVFMEEPYILWHVGLNVPSHLQRVDAHDEAIALRILLP